MCDFVVGAVYTDQFVNEDNWMPKALRDEILSKYPNFNAYG